MCLRADHRFWKFAPFTLLQLQLLMRKKSALKNWVLVMFSKCSNKKQHLYPLLRLPKGGLEWNKCPQLCPPRLLECVNKEFIWEFKRGFFFFSNGKDLNLAGKLFSIKFGLYQIPFPSFLFGKRRALCLPEALWFLNMHLKVSFHFCFYLLEACYEKCAAGVISSWI